MTYNYFTGCTGFDDVKVRFKTLAKQLHPDKGGSHEKFVTMQKEYQTIVGNVLSHKFPLTNIVEFNVDDIFEKMKRAAQESAGFSGSFSNRRAGRSYYAQNSGGFATNDKDTKESQFKDFYTPPKNDKQHIYEKWQAKKKYDPIYQQIEDIFDDSSIDNRSAHWMLMEVFKLKNLSLDHFKYLVYVFNQISGGGFKLNDEWAANSYRAYVQCDSIKWGEL